MSKPRNPRYFPLMKVRGARRRNIAPLQRMSRGFDQLASATAAAANAFVMLSVAMNRDQEQTR